LSAFTYDKAPALLIFSTLLEFDGKAFGRVQSKLAGTFPSVFILIPYKFFVAVVLLISSAPTTTFDSVSVLVTFALKTYVLVASSYKQKA
jgi:hypothetical protein